MGVRFITDQAGLDIPAGDYVNAVSPETLDGAWFMGREIGASARNRVRGKPNAAVIGSPVINPYSCQFQGGEAFLRTALQVGPTVSFMMVAKGVDTHVDLAHQPLLVGTSGANPQEGASIYRTAGNLRLQNILKDGSDASATNTTDVDLASADTAWRCFFGRIGLTGQLLADLTSNTIVTEVNTGLTRVTGAYPLHIGGSEGSTLKGKSEIACVLVWHSEVSPEMRTEQRARLQALYAPRGITF